MFTFILVSSLFLLWGVCNGMIDVMDKHFQEELGLSKVAIRLGAVRPLSGLFPDVHTRRLAGHQVRIQRGNHRGTPDCRAGRVLVHSRHAHQFAGARRARVPHHGVCGFPGRRVRHRHRPHVSRDHRQPLHHRAGRQALRRHAHQPGPVLQRRRLDSGSHHRRRVFLFQGCPGPQHRQPDAIHSLRGHRHRGDGAGGHFLFRQRSGHQGRRRVTTGRLRARRLAFHLVPPAFHAGRGRAVLLRRRAGRRLQFLHQLHDFGSSRHTGLLGRGHEEPLGP